MEDVEARQRKPCADKALCIRLLRERLELRSLELSGGIGSTHLSEMAETVVEIFFNTIALEERLSPEELPGRVHRYLTSDASELILDELLEDYTATHDR